MRSYRKYVEYLRDNPVVLLDLLKYLSAALVLFGLPIPPGVDVAVAGAILAVLTVATRATVVPVAKHERLVDDALHTPPPAPDATGEADYMSNLGDSRE